MLSDRSYMREDESRGGASVLTWLLCAIAAGLILQEIFLRLFREPGLVEGFLALAVPYLHGSGAWLNGVFTFLHLFSYGFVHDPEHLLDFLFIGLSLYFLGRELVPAVGSRRFLGLFFATQAGGGLLWLAVHWRNPDLLMGSAAAVAGLLAVFALLFPNREITILFLFIPVTVKPKYVALTVLAIDLFGCVFYELMGNAPPFSLAPSAHLGGMAVGWVYWRYLHDATWQFPSRRPSIELPKWIKRSPPGAAEPPAYQVNVGSREHLKAEVDRILDKINSQGFGALTAEEKRLLDEARELLSRR